MGAINIHKNEQLVRSDRGVAMMRQRIRKQIRTVNAGNQPYLASKITGMPIPTYGGDSVLSIPKNEEGDDASLLSKLAHEFVDIQFQVDGKSEQQRIKIVTAGLKEMQSRHNSKIK
jgi:hypothetical protein